MLKEKYLPVMIPASFLVICFEVGILYLFPGVLASLSFWSRSLLTAVAVLAPMLAWMATGQLLIFIEKTVARAHTLPGDPEEGP